MNFFEDDLPKKGLLEKFDVIKRFEYLQIDGQLKR